MRPEMPNSLTLPERRAGKQRARWGPERIPGSEGAAALAKVLSCGTSRQALSSGLRRCSQIRGLGHKANGTVGPEALPWVCGNSTDSGSAGVDPRPVSLACLLPWA